MEEKSSLFQGYMVPKNGKCV